MSLNFLSQISWQFHPDLFYWIIDKKTKEEKLIRVKDFDENSFLLYPQTLSNDDMIYFVGHDIGSVHETINPDSNPSIIKMQIENLFKYEK